MLPFIFLLTTATGNVYVEDYDMTANDCASAMVSHLEVYGLTQGMPSCEPGVYAAHENCGSLHALKATVSPVMSDPVDAAMEAFCTGS